MVTVTSVTSETSVVTVQIKAKWTEIYQMQVERISPYVFNSAEENLEKSFSFRFHQHLCDFLLDRRWSIIVFERRSFWKYIWVGQWTIKEWRMRLNDTRDRVLSTKLVDHQVNKDISLSTIWLYIQHRENESSSLSTPLAHILIIDLMSYLVSSSKIKRKKNVHSNSAGGKKCHRSTL